MINTKKLEVSIIVTCGKEPGDLTHNLEALKKVIGWHELIVIVPGDDDYKMESDGVKMLSCPVASRSFQANMGASLAQGNTLLFLTPETAGEDLL